MSGLFVQPTTRELKKENEETKTTAAKLDVLKKAMKHEDAIVRPVYIFGKGYALQVYVKTTKVGPFILPNEKQTLGDIAKMLFDFRTEA